MKRHERAQNQRRAKQTIKRETSGIRIGLNGFRLFCYIPAQKAGKPALTSAEACKA